MIESLQASVAQCLEPECVVLGHCFFSGAAFFVGLHQPLAFMELGFGSAHQLFCS
jgi:hypothetical protein